MAARTAKREFCSKAEFFLCLAFTWVVALILIFSSYRGGCAKGVIAAEAGKATSTVIENGNQRVRFDGGYELTIHSDKTTTWWDIWMGISERKGDDQ